MTQFINPFSVLRHFNMIVRDSGGGGGGGGGNNDNDDYGYDPYEDADLYDDNGYQTEYSGPDYGGNDNDNDNDNDEPLTPIAPPSTPAPYEPPGYDFGGGNDNDTTSPTDESNVYDYYTPPVTYPDAPPDPTLPDDRNFDWDYGPTPFEGPATDDDLGLTDAPISDYVDPQDPYEPNLLDPQTDDDLGFEDTLDTTDIFGPDADLIQDPNTGYVRPMTTQELEQGAFDTRMSYAAPDNVLDQDIGTLDPSSFSTGATITGPSPTDTANAYNFDNIAEVDPYTDTTDFNIGGFDTGPNVDTTAPSGLTGSTDLLGDPINLGAVSPTDLSNVYDFYNEPDSVIGTNTNTLEVDKTAPEGFAKGTAGASPSGYNLPAGTNDYSSDPTDNFDFIDIDEDYYDNKSVTDQGLSIDSATNRVIGLDGEDLGTASDYISKTSSTPDAWEAGYVDDADATAPYTDTTGTTDGYTLNDLDLGTGYTNTTKFPSDETEYDDKTVSTTTVSPTDLSNVYDFYNEPATGSLSTELNPPINTNTGITTNASGAKVYSNGMTEAEMRALYGQYGTTPNDTESKIMRNIMATERHAEDGPIDPKTGKPIYNSGDLVFDERGIDKFNSAANNVFGFFLQGISNGIFGRNFSENQAKNLAAKNKKALEALQKTGKYAYSEDGKTAIGVVDTDGTVILLRTDPSVVEENDSDPYPVCEPGYILVNGVCVPDDSLGTGDGGGGSGTEGRYGGTFAGPIIRPTTPTTPRTPVVTQPTLPAPTIRAPKQFAMGGEVSPGLITAADRFLASLKG
jgi:hypothetical protein